MAAGLSGQWRDWIRARTGAPFLVMGGPVLALAGFWVAGERGLVVAVLALLLLAVATGAWRQPDSARQSDPAEPYSRDRFLAELDSRLMQAESQGMGTGCIVLQFDDAGTLLDRYGRSTQTEVIRSMGERLVSALRQGDRVLRLEGGGFAISLSPSRRLDLEAMVQLSSRLQALVAEPVTFGGARILATCSAGFCMGARVQRGSGAELLDCAQVSADEALRNGPGALRAFAPGMARKRAERDARRAELEEALDAGQIRAWFQPQISADTGEITGFEALARWQHPERGVIPPAEFLPAIGDSGLSERLSEVMVFNALVALSRWDTAGLRVPGVGVNFSSDELRNPRLADKLKWELDRFDLTPDRLSVEVLETVMSMGEADVIVRNITELARLGCRIDLDDFGTGHASITNIRRFGVHRLKIDRSYISRVEQDREAQRVLTAILSMAEQLGLDTLAEGVETPSELALLSQLGCGHVQGFGIARPMPFEATSDWIRSHMARPKVTWKAGNAPG
ncbi:putative bifunctional diguanylate cyclase/phosphodiesterase [Falsigemmobacter faecalis]|uniref:GGDEF domain-containing protein n=1 Tax=Falsigemmobacter faecalis TaxID=2488730 RepID=A0A3P3DIQ3_9RHOB|nr:GGDEF domain-containing phosphodiesterase [Falsigemmobacter faecalis]RRH72498.1 GGDEF domain-containing protein [Falsigemmobacter faecalis]